MLDKPNRLARMAAILATTMTTIKIMIHRGNASIALDFSVPNRAVAKTPICIKRFGQVRLWLFHSGEAGIQFRNTGFRVKPGMTNKATGLVTHQAMLGCQLLYLIVSSAQSSISRWRKWQDIHKVP